MLLILLTIVVVGFQGQYKSTLVCPVCSKVSVTFDPFMYLSLPLPSTINRSMTVTVFSGTGDALPMPYTVTVPKNGLCKDLMKTLSSACCLKNTEALLIAEVRWFSWPRTLLILIQILYFFVEARFSLSTGLRSSHIPLHRESF